MIELTYFDKSINSEAYQVIQFRTGEPWRVAIQGELLGSVEKLDGVWYGRCLSGLNDKLVQDIGDLIDHQHFNRLPDNLKTHWQEYIHEAVAQADNQYLIICKSGVDFERFEKLFKAYIPALVNDEWEIRFSLYDATMSSDFEVLVKKRKQYAWNS